MSKPTPMPLHAHAWSELTKRELINYGATIQWEDFHDAAGLIYPVPEKCEWEARACFIEFCRLAMSKGYKVTEKGCEGIGFRFLNREEMASHCHREALRSSQRCLQNSVMLSQVPTRGLNDAEIQKINEGAVRQAYVGAVMKRMLMQRRLPATPDMAMKAAKKLMLRDQRNEPKPEEPDHHADQ